MESVPNVLEDSVEGTENLDMGGMGNKIDDGKRGDEGVEEDGAGDDSMMGGKDMQRRHQEQRMRRGWKMKMKVSAGQAKGRSLAGP